MVSVFLADRLKGLLHVVGFLQATYTFLHSPCCIGEAYSPYVGHRRQASGKKCLILCYQWLENKYLSMSKASEDCSVFAQAIRESE